MTEEAKYGVYSSARVANGIVYTSGKIGVDATGGRPEGFADEVRAALISLTETLEEHGSGLSELLQVQCILSDMSNFDEFNRVYSEVIPQPVPPRFTHGGALVQNFRFEVVATARVSDASTS